VLHLSTNGFFEQDEPADLDDSVTSATTGGRG